MKIPCISETDEKFPQWVVEEFEQLQEVEGLKGLLRDLLHMGGDEEKEQQEFQRIATSLHLYFLDNIVDNKDNTEYHRARDLFSNPIEFFHKFDKDRKNAIVRFNPKTDADKTEYDNAKFRKHKDTNKNKIMTAEQVYQVTLENANENKDDDVSQRRIETISETNSNFSASFYGPLYEDHDTPRDETVGYFFLKETHIDGEFKYAKDALSNLVRKFICKHLDGKNRNILHLACLNGDRHFVTMILYECQDFDDNIIPSIIDELDSDDLTPLYLLCEQGFRKSVYSNDDDWHILNCLKSGNYNKDQLQEHLLSNKNEDFLENVNFKSLIEEADKMSYNEFTKLDIYQLKNKKETPKEFRHRFMFQAERLLKQGLYYSINTAQMLPLLDIECRRPSRCYLAMILINHGANANHTSAQARFTPLHWLAFWGDYRATRVILKCNLKDTVQPKSKKKKAESSDQIIKKAGAFNLFVADNHQSAADIAGDLNHYKCLQYIVEHFSTHEIPNIREAFIKNEVKQKFQDTRFETEKSKTIKYTVNNTESQEIQLSFLDSSEFTQEQNAYLHLAFWAIQVSNLDKKQSDSDQNGGEVKKEGENQEEFEINSTSRTAEIEREKLLLGSNDQKEEFEVMMKKFLYIFIMDLGISPFIQCYNDANFLSACVLSDRDDFLKELLSHTYVLYNEDDKDVFEESFQEMQDKVGRNVFHLVFKLEGISEQSRFLHPLLETKVSYVVQTDDHDSSICKPKAQSTQVQPGRPMDPVSDEENNKNVLVNKKPVYEKYVQGMTQRGMYGLLPCEVTHAQPIEICSTLSARSQDVKAVLFNSHQADYVIVCQEKNKQEQNADIIENQLGDLNFMRDKDYYIITERDCSCGLLSSVQVCECPIMIFFALKYTSILLDKIAEEMKIKADLDGSNLQATFYKDQKETFQSFDARQKYTLITAHLKREIDFELLEKQEIILAHYPLHTFDTPRDFITSYEKHRLMIVRSFFFFMTRWKRDWRNLHLQPFMVMKRYYGERHSFFFIYCEHYNAFLIYPAILGLSLFIYQIYWFTQTGNMGTALDSSYNGIFGIIVSLWATAFVESWRKKETYLIHAWDLDSVQEVLKNDECKEFKYEMVYNSQTNTKMKEEVKPSKWWSVINLLFVIGAVVLQVGLMIFFEILGYDDVEDFNADVLADQILQDFIDPISVMYQIVLATIGMIVDILVEKLVEKKNFRYAKDKNDKCQLQKFMFQFINVFLPIGYVAFVRQNYLSLFTMLFINFGFEPVKEMVISGFIPPEFGFLQFLWKKKSVENTFYKSKLKASNLCSFKHTKDFVKSHANDAAMKKSHLVDEGGIGNILPPVLYSLSTGNENVTKECDQKNERFNCFHFKKQKFDKTESGPMGWVDDNEECYSESEEEVTESLGNYSEFVKEHPKPPKVLSEVGKFVCDDLRGSNEAKTNFEKGTKIQLKNDIKKLVKQQVKYNNELEENEFDTESEYMGFVLQFGLIIFFSSVFPLAAMCSLIANYIKLYMLTHENKTKRRQMPQISIGIGQFMYMIRLLSHMAIVVNMSIVYFTSSTFRQLFVTDREAKTVCFGFTEKCIVVQPKAKLFAHVSSFLVAIIVVEHVIELIQFLIAKLFEDDSSFIKMERINSIMFKQYMDMVRFKDNINKRMKKEPDDDRVTEDFEQQHDIIRRKNYLKHHYKDVKSIQNYKLQQKDGVNINVELFPDRRDETNLIDMDDDKEQMKSIKNQKKELEDQNRKLAKEFNINHSEAKKI